MVTANADTLTTETPSSSQPPETPTCNGHGGVGTSFLSNHSGGIQGGISNGQPIPFRVAFKPVATLLRPQQTIDIHGNVTTINPRGRHDPCVLPRAVPIVEAMAAMTIVDAIELNNKTLPPPSLKGRE